MSCSTARRSRSRSRAGSRRRSRRSGRCSRGSSSVRDNARSDCSSIRASALRYDFVMLRAQAGEAAQELADWWTRFQTSDPAERESMLRPEEHPKKRRRSRGRGRKRDADADVAAERRTRSSRVMRRTHLPTRTSEATPSSDDARLRRPRQQPGAPATTARARGARAGRLPRTRLLASRRAMSRRRKGLSCLSRTTSMQSPCSPRRSARARCSTGFKRSSGAIGERAREPSGMLRGRSISICYYSAAVACA